MADVIRRKRTRAQSKSPVKQAVRKLPAQRFEIIVECASEAQQRELYQELTARGWKCRVLTF